MWWAWPSLAFLSSTITTPRCSKPLGRPPRPWEGARSRVWCIMRVIMVIRLCHAAHHLPVSSHEAWDSRGSMNMGAIQTSHNPPPTALIRCVCRPPEPPT